MHLILSNTGAKVEFDEEDYDLVRLFSWREKKVSDRLSYAVSQSSICGIRLSHRMHRIILSASDGQVVDHIDGNGLNNRRSNLRICTQRDNLRSARRIARRSSGILNVAALENGRYMGVVVIDGHRKKKTFDNSKEASTWVESVR